MSDIESFENDGGAVETERTEYNYSPAAGLGNDTAESDRVDDTDDVGDEPDAEGDATISLSPKFRGTYTDPETGLRFRRGREYGVDADTAERLLQKNYRGASLFVRADS